MDVISMDSDLLTRHKLQVLTEVVDLMVFTNPVIKMLAKMLPVPVSTSAVLASETDVTIRCFLLCVSEILPLVQDDRVGMDNFSEKVGNAISVFKEIMDAEHRKQDAGVPAKRAKGRSKVAVSG